MLLNRIGSEPGFGVAAAAKAVGGEQSPGGSQHGRGPGTLCSVLGVGGQGHICEKPGNCEKSGNGDPEGDGSRQPPTRPLPWVARRHPYFSNLRASGSPTSELRAAIVPRFLLRFAPRRGHASTALPSPLPFGSSWSTALECPAPVGGHDQEQMQIARGRQPGKGHPAAAPTGAARGSSPQPSSRTHRLANHWRSTPALAPVSVGPTGRGVPLARTIRPRGGFPRSAIHKPALPAPTTGE